MKIGREERKKKSKKNIYKLRVAILYVMQFLEHLQELPVATATATGSQKENLM